MPYPLSIYGHSFTSHFSQDRGILDPQRRLSNELPFYLNETFWGTWINLLLYVAIIYMPLEAFGFSIFTMLKGRPLLPVMLHYLVFIPIWFALCAYKSRLRTFCHDLGDFKDCVRVYGDYSNMEIRAAVAMFREAFWMTFRIWGGDQERVVYRRGRFGTGGRLIARNTFNRLKDSEFITIKVEEV